MEKIYEYKRFGFSLTIYPGTLSVIDQSGGLKKYIAPNQTDILLKNITGVYLNGITKKLRLSLNDGSFREFPVYGKESEKVREILRKLI